MGRSKKGKKSREEVEESWDSASDISNGRSEAGFGPISTYEDNPLEQICEALYEKRTSTRETALKNLLAYLRSDYRYETCDTYRETLMQLCLGILKKGKAKEVELASQSAMMVMVTIGTDSWTDSTTKQFLPVLDQKMFSKLTPPARVAVTRAYGFLCFIGTEDSELLENCIEKLAKLALTTGGSVRCEAYNMLALLFTISSPIGRAISAKFAKLVEMFKTALDDPSVEVRGAAGNALVVLNENFSGLLDGDDSDDSSGDEDYEKRRALQESVEDGLSDKMEKLATSSWSDEPSGKRLNRKQRSNQRAVFRHLLEVLRGNATKETKIKLKHGDVLVLETHSHRITASVLKSVLTDGFQVHLQNNDLFHQIFNFQPRQNKIQLTALEKRMYLSPNSQQKKEQTRERKKGRAQRNSVKLDFFEQED